MVAEKPKISRIFARDFPKTHLMVAEKAKINVFVFSRAKIIYPKWKTKSAQKIIN